MYICPLCMKTDFPSLDSLCFELTKVTIKHIQCPVCAETVLGLDKYTIHLYSHLLQKENQSKNKTSETVTLNVLVKNMCRVLDPQAVSPTSGVDTADFITKNKDIVNFSLVEMSDSAIAHRNGDADRAFRASPRVEQSKTNPRRVLPGFAQELLPSVEKLSSIVAQNFPTQPLDAPKLHFPVTCKESRVISTSPSHFTRANRSAPVVLGFSSNAALPAGESNGIVAPSFAHSKDPPLLAEVVTEKPAVEGKSPVEVNPSFFFVLPETSESGARLGNPNPEFMTIESQAKATIDSRHEEAFSGELPARCDSAPRASNHSPFEFEEFIKLKPADAPKDERKPFKCPQCSFAFPDVGILKMHQQLVHKQDPPGVGRCDKKVYCCQYCNKGFKMKGSLLVHHRVAHKHLFPDLEKSSKARGSEGANSPENLGPTEYEHQCNICFKTFKKEQFLSQHYKTHESKQWECDVCSKSFTTKYFLKKHKRLHTGDQRYFCELCNRSFTFQQSYRKHILYHSDEKPYPCTTCGRTFKELSTLHNHERIHTGEKPYSCETCGKSFRQRISCLVHSRIHTGAMPYACTACHKKFRYKGSEKSHKCPVSPPGQIVLCDTEKKSTSLLSSIKQKLSVRNPAPESNSSRPLSDSQASSGVSPQSKAMSPPQPSPQYFILLPMAEDCSPPKSQLDVDPGPTLTRKDETSHPCCNAGQEAQRVDQTGAKDLSAYDDAVRIAAPDFFSDPDELFASLTFSP
ncbi:unnamed protein product [Bemisia tabaci]|uniref:C2H2-type domain-containing protein n=2 Tax=Bemisia tabaci TaxID=7038 RepID=A0A9P0CDA6_BEMTA|nr:unnamed protein product [Bemisia tabaci]